MADNKSTMKMFFSLRAQVPSADGGPDGPWGNSQGPNQAMAAHDVGCDCPHCQPTATKQGPTASLIPSKGPFGPWQNRHNNNGRSFAHARPGLLGDCGPDGPWCLTYPAGPSRARVSDSPPEDALFVGLGYLPELPDHRDYQFGKFVPDSVDALKKLSQLSANPANTFPFLHGKSKLKRNDKRDLRRELLRDPNAAPKDQYFNGEMLKGIWPVEDQGQLNSCTANAVIGLVEFLIRSGLKQSVDLSRLFLYSNTRRLLNLTGDSGAYIRSTIKAMAIFGVPPEEYWPYMIENFDVARIHSFSPMPAVSSQLPICGSMPTRRPEEHRQSLQVTRKAKPDGPILRSIGSRPVWLTSIR